MTSESTRVTDAELAVLESLWQRGPATIRALTAQVYPRSSTSDYATVQKLLERLEDKGCVARDRSGFAHRFAAIVAREDLIGQQLESVAQKLCEGSLTPLLLHLVQATPLTSAQRAELRRMLDAAEDDSQNQG
jgi:predicted transcriptional regulator